MKKLLGLIGYPVSHSFSKRYFSQKFTKQGISNYEYQLFSLEKITQLPTLIRNKPKLVGLNVTIPHKQAVLPYLQYVAPAAAQVGAVNTIKIMPNGNLHGYNTDTYGFKKSLVPLLQAQHTNALILGNGGAAKAVSYVLQQLGITYKIVSRSFLTNGFTYQTLSDNIITSHPLIINTSPLGMYPNINSAPNINYKALSSQHLCYDLVYNPENTLFMQKAAATGAVVKNGLEMLHLQAEKAWQIWTEPVK